MTHPACSFIRADERRRVKNGPTDPNGDLAVGPCRSGLSFGIMRLIDDISECNFLDNRCEWPIKSCDLPVMSARPAQLNRLSKKTQLTELFCNSDVTEGVLMQTKSIAVVVAALALGLPA